MKTKILSPLRRDGYKAGMIMMLIALSTMLLTTACSSEDDIVNNENTIKKGFELPVTVNVTRQGDATTRATFDGSKLNFSTGDKLLVRGNDNSDGGAGRFAGLLDYDTEKGNFSGTIYTENSYSGTADALFTAANSNWVGAALFPSGYETYQFLSISGSGYSTSYSMSYNKAIAATKAAAVEQFSLETAKTYSSGFTLAPENAILNFTITGLTDGEKAVTLMNGSKTMFTGSVTPTSGTAAFALGARIKDNSDFPVNLKNVILTIGDADIDITSTNNNLVAGKIYNITRAVPAPAAVAHALSAAVVGDVVGSDGQAYNGTDYNNLPTGVTAVAKVCYVSGGHGLALALGDEGSKKDWSTAKTTCEAHTPAVTGGTWQLPSQDDWNNMITAAGSYTDLRDGFSSVGGTNMQSDDRYWSSTESDSDRAWVYNFSNGKWGYGPKDFGYYVRACLAF